MKIAVHPHVRSNAENLRQLDALLKASHAGICFDSAHLEALRIDLSEVHSEVQEQDRARPPQGPQGAR